MPAVSLYGDPVTVALVGDLGQTNNSRQTVRHILAANPLLVLHAGDLAYADCYQPRWDSYGRMIEPLAARVPVMTTQGNHEVESTGECGRSMNSSFAAYNARYRNPSKESNSSSNLYYSFDSAGMHVLMLGSYANVSKSSDQLKWLQRDLAKVNRTETPWLVAVLHAPWYNSNKDHQHESQEDEMRASMERVLRQARLDAMLAGHVHAYERIHRVFDGKLDACAPAYFNIGDGGNREGLSRHYKREQPSWSAYREASFGHALLEIYNATHAHFTWHRDQDGERVVSDDYWLVRSAACSTNESIGAAEDATEIVV